MNNPHQNHYSNPNSVHRSRRWTVVSRLIRGRQPLCCNPYGLHDTPAFTETVHHIEPLDQHPELAFIPSNLVALCWRCHNHVEQLHRKGVPTMQTVRLAAQRYWPMQYPDQGDDPSTVIHSPLDPVGQPAPPLPSPTGATRGGVPKLDDRSPETVPAVKINVCDVPPGGPLCVKVAPAQVWCCILQKMRHTKCGSCSYL